MTIKNMPSHDHVKFFSNKLAEKTGYNYINEKSDSLVVLLSNKLKPARFDK